MNVISLTCESRQSFGKQPSKELRRKEMVPGVVYGGSEVVHFYVDEAALKPIIYTPAFNLVEIEVEGKKYKTVLKDAQFHPVHENVTHVDFQELVADRKVKVSVPLQFYGESKGVKQGGTLVPVLRKIQIKTTPDRLVSDLKGNISSLRLDQSLYVRELEIPEGIEVLTVKSTPVAYIEVPRSLKSTENAALLAAAKKGIDLDADEDQEGA
jgi:large subunit ribosomal protein L25